MSVTKLLPIFLAVDLLLPFVLSPMYKGYSHLTQVMSVLGNSKAPLHVVYNIWLLVLGSAIILGAVYLRQKTIGVSSVLANILCTIMVIYAIGGCLIAGLFSVGETKEMVTISAKVHGVGSAIGFMILMFAPLLIGLVYLKMGQKSIAGISLGFFVLAIVFFVLFVMADKEIFQETIISWEGLWQRLSLLCAYVPVGVLCFYVDKV